MSAETKPFYTPSTMNKLYLLTSLCAGSLFLTACTNDSDELIENYQPVVETQAEPQTDLFPEPDNAKQLSGKSYVILSKLLYAAGPDIIKSLGYVNITEKEYNEIKDFADELTAGIDSETEKYRTLFRWVCSNVKYGHSDNDPYPVFINRIAVCQGYSNLMHVMCHSQGIRSFLVNGMLDPLGGHAWLYAYVDGVWTVSDPTNSGSYDMDKTSEYTHLLPYTADVDLFEDEVAIFNFADQRLNIKEIKSTNTQLTVPYSAGGYVVTSFNPSVDLPKEVTELYIGKNITSLGESPIGLSVHGKNVEAIHIAEANRTLRSHCGVVYKKNGTKPSLYHIPTAMKRIELLPLEVIQKNTIYNHANVEEIVFVDGTKTIESYAIENCPRLKRVYVPEGTEMAKDALYNVPSNVEIIRGSVSGITHVKM